MSKKETNGKNQTETEAEKKARSVFELSASEAREFFLKDESFCNMDLPTYFVFEDLLRQTVEVGRRISVKTDHLGISSVCFIR